jgi:hypothetical protein
MYQLYKKVPGLDWTGLLIFFEKKGLKFFKKSSGATKFYEQMNGSKNHTRLFCCHLVQN